jgi:hypothetical protein
MAVRRHLCFDFSCPSPLPRPLDRFVLLLRWLLLRGLPSGCGVMMLAEMLRRSGFVLAGDLQEERSSFVIVSAMLFRDTHFRISPFKHGPCSCLHPPWTRCCSAGQCTVCCGHAAQRPTRTSISQALAAELSLFPDSADQSARPATLSWRPQQERNVAMVGRCMARLDAGMMRRPCGAWRLGSRDQGDVPSDVVHSQGGGRFLL